MSQTDLKIYIDPMRQEAPFITYFVLFFLG